MDTAGETSPDDGMKVFSGEKQTSLFAVPWTVSLVLTLFLFRGILLTKPAYAYRTLITAGLLLAFWTFHFIKDQIKRRTQDVRCRCILCHPVWVLVLGFVIGVFMTYAIWGSDYLTLAPFERIDNGTQRFDTLLHSTLAESFRRSPFASMLLNDERYWPYHTFSHLLMAAVAGLLRMPAFFAYNYLFPVIFLPLYPLSLLLAVSAAKEYFTHGKAVGAIDGIIIALFIVGAVPETDRFAVWKTGYIISESFLVANILLLLSYALTFILFSRDGVNERKMRIYCSLCIPLEIFVITWCKISVGMLFAASVMYYIFRTELRRIRFWILNIMYLAVFFAAFLLFNYSGRNLEGEVSAKLSAFAFVRKYCDGAYESGGHYLILLFPAICFIILACMREHFHWEDIRNAKTVWIEDILIVCLLGVLPGMVMDIAAGAAVYFSYTAAIPSIVLLCGHDWIHRTGHGVGILRGILVAAGFVWCIMMGLRHRAEDPYQFITGEHSSGLCDMLLQIRETAGSHPERYMIYLDADAAVTRVFSEGRSAAMVCPAITGIGVINATYREGDTYYTFDGQKYKGRQRVARGPLSYDEAVAAARNLSKEYIIRITDTGYQIAACR